MKKCINGKYVEMTDKEISELEKKDNKEIDETTADEFLISLPEAIKSQLIDLLKDEINTV